jgi:hypothetical protein
VIVGAEDSKKLSPKDQKLVENIYHGSRDPLIKNGPTATPFRNARFPLEGYSKTSSGQGDGARFPHLFPQACGKALKP